MLRQYSPSEIEKKDIAVQTKIYPNIHAIFPDMTEIINCSLSLSKETKIEIMGLTLYHMWEYTKNFLKNPSIQNMNIVFCMIDSNSPNIRCLRNNWGDTADVFYNSIKRYMEDNDEELKRRSINIQIFRYNNVPVIHGILINEEHLFLSYTSWTRNDRMEGALNFYSYYNLDSEIGKSHIEIFKNWINHIKKNKCQDIFGEQKEDN